MSHRSSKLASLISLCLSLLATASVPIALDIPVLFFTPQVLAQTQEDRKAEADRLREQGNQQLESNEFAAALQSFQQALAIYRELSHTRGLLRTTSLIGITYYSLGETERAIDILEKVVASAQEAKIPELEQLASEVLQLLRNQSNPLQKKADRLLEQGNQQFYRSQYREALQSWENALSIYREIGDRNGEASSYNNLGEAYRSLGEYQRAIEFLQQSLDIAREIGARNVEASSLGGLGNAYISLGQYPKAIEFFQQSLDIAREIGDRNGEAASLGNLGVAYRSLGQYQRAIEYHKQALAIDREIGDRKGEASSLGNLGVAYRSLGQYQRAIEYHKQALAIDREIGDRNGEARSLGNLGNAYDSLGQYQRAIEFLQQSLAIFREIGARNGEADSLGNLGIAYGSLGQYQRAIEYFQQSLAIFREIGDRNEEANSYNNLGLASFSLGEYQRAIKFYQQSLAIKRKIGDRNGEANSLGNLGLAYQSVGKYQRAIEFHQQSLAITREIGDRNGEANSLGGLGIAYLYLGQYQRAIEFLQQSLDIAREIGDRNGEASSYQNLGVAYDSLGQYQRAIEFYQQAIEVKESIQGEIKVDELKASFASQQVDVYVRLINLLWEKGDFKAAFNYAERARARAFLDQLANGRVDFRAGADSKLVEREQALKDQIIALRQQLIKLRNRPQDQWDTKTITETEDKLKTLQKDYDNLIIELKIQSPEVAALKTVDVASLEEIQSLLDADTTLVEYFVTGDQTLAFIITKNSFKTVTLDVTPAALIEELVLFYDFTNRDESHPAELKQLQEWLIAPLKPHLNTLKVGIVPHSILHYLPFAALTDGNTYLSDDYALFTIPSASVLRFLPDKRKSETVSLLALGDPVTPNLPPLVHAREEVKAIAPLFNTKAFVRDQATESTVKSKAEQAGIVHLAAHGEYNPHNPLFSTLHLTGDPQNDGQLQVHEI